MKVSSTSNKAPRELVPKGPQEAICYGAIDMGHQSFTWEGETKIAHKIRYFFEIPECMITYTNKDGDQVTAPQVINCEFTISSSPKGKLKPAIEGWLGKEIDTVDIIKDCVGSCAQLNVVHKMSKKGTVYANIGSISALSPKLAKLMPEQHNPTMTFDIDEDGFASDKFKALYPWLREVVEESVEFKDYIKIKLASNPAVAQDWTEDDDIPFAK